MNTVATNGTTYGRKNSTRKAPEPTQMARVQQQGDDEWQDDGDREGDQRVLAA